LVAEGAEALRRVHAAVVELDALTDPVRARAQDHHPRPVARRRRLVDLAERRVVVVGGRLDLARAGVDAPVDTLSAGRAVRLQQLDLPPEPGMEPFGKVFETRP